MNTKNLNPPEVPKGWKNNSSEIKDKKLLNVNSSDQFQDPGRGTRLHKIMSRCECGSRRICEMLIKQGSVKVNGHTVTYSPAWVNPSEDIITVNGRKLKQTTTLIYTMLYKPRGTITTSNDPEGRTTVCDLVKHPSKKRLYPVGRLDTDSSGLILMTNDGELANKITHPKYGVIKEYQVTVRGEINENSLRRLRNGIFLHEKNNIKSRKTKKTFIKISSKSREKTNLQIKLHEGRNRQIRRMLTKIGYPVHRLKRTRLGPLKLKDLQAGQWRDLFPEEVLRLRRECSNHF